MGEIYRASTDLAFQGIIRNHTSTNGCKGLPAQFVSYTNILTTTCPQCPNSICSAHHLIRKHQLNIQTPEEIIRLGSRKREQQQRLRKEKKTGPSRDDVIESMAQVCTSNLIKVKTLLDKLRNPIKMNKI